MNYKNFTEDQISSPIMRNRRLEWLGHIWRVNEQIIKWSLVAELRGKRPLDQPRKIWKSLL